MAAEYIVNGLEVKNGRFNKSDFPKDKEVLFERVNVIYRAFYKYGRTYSDYLVAQFSPWEIGKEYFLTKKEAEEACRKKHDEQKKKLDEFNEAHGTHYEYPFVS